MVEAIGGADSARFGSAGVDRGPDLAGQHLAQLDTPLVEGVDAPDEALQQRSSYHQDPKM